MPPTILGSWQLRTNNKTAERFRSAVPTPPEVLD